MRRLPRGRNRGEPRRTSAGVFSWTQWTEGGCMLVLSRRKHESIYIGANQEIEVCIANVSRNGKVRLGITAPSGVPIVRDELVDAWRERHAGQQAVQGTEDRGGLRERVQAAKAVRGGDTANQAPEIRPAHVDRGNRTDVQDGR